jgi:hypothetical protein
VTRALFVVVMLGACSGGSSGPDALPAGTCVPDGYWTWPADCTTAVCNDIVCDATCETGDTCERLDCTQSPQCRIECQDKTHCPDIDCRGGDFCFATCLGAGISGGDCTMHGEGAGASTIECLDGATCLLDCGSSPSSQCRISNCTGGTGITDCGNGISVCNRPCP